MDHFKSKNALVITFEVVLIILGIIGVTFATSRLLGSTSKTIITTGNYELDYKGETEVIGNNLEPISDSKININSFDSVMRLEFSLRGTEKNNDTNLIYDLVLKDMNIDCSLLNEYTKWNLYKNGVLISHGNFSPKFDGNIKSDNYYLTNIQEDLPKANDAYDNYVFIVWISESCDDLETCKYIDQSNIINKTMNMTLFVAVYADGKKELERVADQDLSCANAPDLNENMIPVYYEDGVWKIANKMNTNSWYNYDKGIWANAIIPKDNSYLSKEAGTKIPEEDILSIFTWIPRYKYLTWNVENEITDTYDAYHKGIDIIFTPGLSKEKASNKNNEYIVHPAFEESRGFWISKYELSKEEDNLVINKNKEPLLNENIDAYQELINKYNENNKLNAKIINNLEWGATLYLSHSKYGICKNNVCQSIETNDSLSKGNNKYDSTTRSVYGVFDMSGSASEYVVGTYKLGDATNEIKLSEDEYWYDAYQTEIDDYSLRGGIDQNAYSMNTFGMNDYSTRITIKN